MTTVGAFCRGPPTSQSSARSWNGTEILVTNEGDRVLCIPEPWQKNWMLPDPKPLAWNSQPRGVRIDRGREETEGGNEGKKEGDKMREKEKRRDGENEGGREGEHSGHHLH